MSPATLHYVADPMCSWCWGFRPELERIRAEMPGDIELRYVMGGLAKDSDEPMPDEVQAYVQNAWREVTARTGTDFNWDFWTRCQPRRSTYPACRAVLAVEMQRPGSGPSMFAAIQRAYYQQARNPSDADTLIELSGELENPVDRDRFAADLQSKAVEQRLQAEFTLRRSLGVRTFPSMVLSVDGDQRVLLTGYDKASTVLAKLADAS